jgi:hypothetical protein
MTRATKDIYQYALGAIVVLGFFIVVYVLIDVKIEPANMNLLSLIVGALISAFVTVVTYFYGSSKGSSEKEERLREEADKGFYLPPEVKKENEVKK